MRLAGWKCSDWGFFVEFSRPRVCAWVASVRTGAYLERMTALWMQIAARYRERPDSVYFELYNEPHDKFDAVAWNEAIPRLLAAVRKSKPARPVIVGPVSWNNIRVLDQLKLPESDRHLIATVHYYEPFEFTHQGGARVL
jgi:endoglucanase